MPQNPRNFRNRNGELHTAGIGAGRAMVAALARASDSLETKQHLAFSLLQSLPPSNWLVKGPLRAEIRSESAIPQRSARSVQSDRCQKGEFASMDGART